MFTAEDVYWQYWISFYTSVFLLVGGEVGPRNYKLAAFASVMIILGSIFTAILFGEMAVLMSNISARWTKFQNMQDSANTTMKNMQMP